jgi:hypothetical protein
VFSQAYSPFLNQGVLAKIRIKIILFPLIENRQNQVNIQELLF